MFNFRGLRKYFNSENIVVTHLTTHGVTVNEEKFRVNDFGSNGWPTHLHGVYLLTCTRSLLSYVCETYGIFNFEKFPDYGNF